MTEPSTPLPAPTLAPEPTGVPGLDADDPWCSSWAVYSGTVQAIGIAGAFGELRSVDIAALELMAAASVVAALTGIADRWPGELAAERSAVLDDLLGPFGRRADKALAALRAAGATDDDIGRLGTQWLAALRARDPQNPVIEVQAPTERLASIVGEAATGFDVAVTPFAHDPSLRVDEVEVPATDAYLAGHCPDLASSGVGDAI